MAKVAVFIHGMWGTPGVWRNWRPAFEARGWSTQAPALRHHDPAWTERSPSDPGVAVVSLLDYLADLEAYIGGLCPSPADKPVLVGHSMGGLLALMLAARAAVLLTPAPPAGVFALRLSNLRAFLRIETRWAWWRKPHCATRDEALWHTFNTTDPAEGAREYEAFVPDSGRALLEIGLPRQADAARRRASHRRPVRPCRHLPRVSGPGTLGARAARLATGRGRRARLARRHRRPARSMRWR